jgi:hypothetical protein
VQSGFCAADYPLTKFTKVESVFFCTAKNEESSVLAVIHFKDGAAAEI